MATGCVGLADPSNPGLQVEGLSDESKSERANFLGFHELKRKL